MKSEPFMRFIRIRRCVKENYNQFKIDLQLRVNMRKKKLPINICCDIGIGAKLIWYLELLLFCEEQRLEPYFKFSYEDSTETDDFFGSYFLSSLLPYNKYIKIHSIEQLKLKKGYNNLLSVEKASELIKSNLIMNNQLNDYIISFCVNKFDNQNVLGIHYRGTDKIREASYVDYEKVLSVIQKCMELTNKFTKIFVATDDANFLDYLLNTKFCELIISHDDYYRSANQVSIHSRINLNRYNVNRDAIVNIMLLSKCDFIIKSSSFLSSISLLLNPKIPFVMLNKPYDEFLWFPERELIGKVAFDV